MRQAPALALVEQRQEQRAACPGVGQVALQAEQLTLVDDAGVVRVVGQLRKEALYGQAIGLDKGFQALLGNQYVIGRNAGLAGIERLAEGDPLGGLLQWYVGRDDGRRLAAQLQGHRRQVGRGALHDLPADLGGAGKQQVIEGQAGELLAGLDIAQHHRNFVFGENLAEQVAQQAAGRRRRFAHLQHHPIACRQRADQRADGQVERVVPRHDDAHHPQRLIDDPRTGRLESQTDPAPRWLHPAPQMAAGVADAMQARHQFGEQGLVGRAMTEIRADRLDQSRLVSRQNIAQRVQPAQTVFLGWHRFGGECCTLASEHRFKGGECLWSVG